MWLRIINNKVELEKLIAEHTPNNTGTYSFNVCVPTTDIVHEHKSIEHYREMRNKYSCAIFNDENVFKRVYYFVEGEITASGCIFYSEQKVDLFEIDGILLQPSKVWGKTTFGFTIADDFTHYGFEVREWEKTHPSPRKTSKPNEKVLREWLHWLQAKKEYQDKIDFEKLTKTNSILQTLQRIAEPNDKVTPTSGHITRGGVVLRYHVKDGEVFSTFEIASGIRNIETFMKYFDIN